MDQTIEQAVRTLAPLFQVMIQQQGPGGVASKAVSSTPTQVYGHGMYGRFAVPGMERDVVNAMIMPRYGLLDAIPSRTATTDNPLYGIMTGVTDTSGSERNGVCDDPPVSGLMKLCTHAFVWGRFARMTKVIDIRRLGRSRDRSDFDDFNLIGNPLNQTGALPTMPGNFSASQALKTEVAKALFELAVGWGRDFARILWNGSPTNNTAGDGYKEPYGLDILVNTGYRDAVTGVACPAADSIVLNMASAEVSSNGAAYVRKITNVIRRLKFIASRTGLDPATWAIVGTRTAFYELTEVWPCAYYTYRCQSDFSTSQQQVIDAGDTIALRDGMRQGMYLLVDGEKIPFIEDDTVVETALPGSSFRSSLYIIPLRVVGNTPATFLEYFDYSDPAAAMGADGVLAPKGSFYTTNGGRYLWTPKTPTNGCVQLMGETDWRIILLTPQIAARIDNVKYTPVAHERDWDVDGSFYVNGGGTTRTDASYFSPTA